MPENTPAGQTSDEETEAGAPGQDADLDSDEPTIPKAKLDEAIRSRDAAKKKARELQARLEELEAARAAAADEDAKASKDVDRLRGHYEDKLTKLQAKLDEAQQKLRATVVEREVRDKARGLIRDDLIDEFYTLNASVFDVGEEDGQQVAVVKDARYSSVEEFVKDFAERKPVFAKNPRRSGGDVPDRSDTTGTQSGATVQALRRMTVEQRREALKGNPKLAQELLEAELATALRR